MWAIEIMNKYNELQNQPLHERSNYHMTHLGVQKILEQSKFTLPRKNNHS
jgi:hypothetical protein